MTAFFTKTDDHLGVSRVVVAAQPQLAQDTAAGRAWAEKMGAAADQFEIVNGRAVRVRDEHDRPIGGRETY